MEADKQREIKEVIIKANPSIMDLVFGCELERPDSNRYYKVIEDIGFASNSKRVWVNSVPFGSMDIAREVEKDEILAGNGETWKIIGRPIRLADVLLALSLNYAFDKNDWSYSIIQNEWEFVDEDGTTQFMWNLKDDNFDNQSEETKEFLHELLVPNTK